ncbi:MAG TPA: DinB family protein [Sphingomicrobium sp.]|jgi:uncharacterized damage-inducible protein DinB|nr:DinB family protein [Sphingomicrobium sp.]
MASNAYSDLVRFKQWADEGLHEVVARSIDQLPQEDRTNLLRLLDHILVVDLIFRDHLEGRSSDFTGPRSDRLPDLKWLMETSREVDSWYVSYVKDLPVDEFDRKLSFKFTSGKPALMTRGEIIQHVVLHGTYHRGMAGVLLQKNGVDPNDDRVTDFLELAA